MRATATPLDTAPPDAALLLAWYDRHRRDLPWRARPGEPPDPYRVWLSEIMLQQTTVAAVLPRWPKFLDRFPTVQALAAAPWDAVAAAWAGLGYYARARNLHAAAQRLAEGGFPETEAGWRALPGVGDYTAAAIAAIGLGLPAVPADGNVERVMARLFRLEQPLPAAKRVLAAQARAVGASPAAQARPGDFAQALFDLGATICTPRRPACALCPWRAACRARAAGVAEALPAKAPKAARPKLSGAVFWAEDASGQVWLRRRPPSGLLGGMVELPGTEWLPDMTVHDAMRLAPVAAPWRVLGEVRHGFTHFELTLTVLGARLAVLEPLPSTGFVVARENVLGAGLPSVMAKAARLTLASRL
jgi:A/G-specific adenine glycosylase